MTFPTTPTDQGLRGFHSDETRLKMVANSNQDAAKLLLQVRMIAMDELTHDEKDGRLVHPITPIFRPRNTVSVPVNISLDARVGGRMGNISPENFHSITPTNHRCRTVSFRCQSFEEGSTNKEALTLQRACSDFVSSDSLAHRVEGYVKSPYVTLLPEPSDEDEEDASSHEDDVTPDGTPDDEAICPHRFVGESLPPGVAIRDVLRKKFSWKSFPELEAYLVDNRYKYLECSNAMNYTKAQKQYNNQLTQGLLDLAAREGYLFEGFTFAAVRDRIRCFYKSFVQANKKKKRLKIYKRGRSMTV